MADKNDDILKAAQARYTEIEGALAETREMAIADLKFARLGEQWPADIMKRRTQAPNPRPCLTINKMPAFIRQVVNDARQNRPSIKTRPVDGGADVETAKIYDGLIRHIEAISDADVAYDTAIDYAVSSSIGYFRIDVDYTTPNSFELEIKIDRIDNPMTVLFDPESRRADSLDWKDAFITDWVEKDEFKRQYPDAKEIDFEGAGDYDSAWLDRETKSVLVAEYFKRTPSEKLIYQLSNGMIVEAEKTADPMFAAYMQAARLQITGERVVGSYKVKHYVMSGAEVLKDEDWPGCYIPIVPVFGEEINVEGKRHFRSLIRDAKDVQRMFNYWRTTATELVALTPKAPWVGRKGAFETDAGKWATANTQDWAFLEYDGAERPIREPFSGVPAGVLQEALNATDDMKAVLGMYDASLGARSNETSGIAIATRQREGDTSTFHFIDNLTRAIRCAGRIIIDLIPKVYNTQRVIRILGDDGTAENVPLNQPVNAMTESGEIQRIYDLSVGNYDIVVEAGPSFTTRRQETAAQMTEFIRAYPAAAPLIGDLFAKNLDWPEAKEIGERLRLMLPPQLRGEEQGPPPEVMAAQAKAKAEIETAQAKAATDLQIKQQSAAADIQIAREKAQAEIEIERMKALAKIEIDAQAAQKRAELQGVAAIAKSMTAAPVVAPIQ